MSDWPYAEDGVREDEPTNQYRFPIIDSPYPRWRYITAVVVSNLWGGIRPTDAELAVVASYHAEYCDHWYGPTGTGWRGRVMEKRPLDIDGGANGRYLIKSETKGWGYRKMTWIHGPVFAKDGDSPHSLVELLDRIESYGDGPTERWQQWKAQHADVFAEVSR